MPECARPVLDLCQTVPDRARVCQSVPELCQSVPECARVVTDRLRTHHSGGFVTLSAHKRLKTHERPLSCISGQVYHTCPGLEPRIGCATRPQQALWRPVSNSRNGLVTDRASRARVTQPCQSDTVVPEKARSVPDLCQTVPDCARVCQTVPDCARVCQTVPEPSRERLSR